MTLFIPLRGSPTSITSSAITAINTIVIVGINRRTPPYRDGCTLIVIDYVFFNRNNISNSYNNGYYVNAIREKDNRIK